MGSVDEKKMKVLIIGAGPAGCALAHGLKKAGISFTIYDKGADVYRHRHWAFTLGWARPYLLGMLPEDLGAQINSCQVDPYVDCAAIGEDRIVLYNGQTREEAFAFPIPKAREINIRQLRILCAEQLDVKYGKRFSHYETIQDGGVRVFFEDGSTDEGDIVIGIDGAMSKVRHCLLGREAAMDILPFALMNFNASYTAEQALFIKERLHPLVDIAIHPAGHYIRANVLDMPDEKDPTKWTFQILSTWPLKVVEDHDNEVDRLKRLKAHVKRDGWAEPYKSAIEWIPEGTEVLRDQLKIWKTVPWDNQKGRVTLCGDAAHAMTFHRGQGANNAFYSAHCLVEALKSVQDGTASLESAITAYDESIWKRGANEVQISKAQTFFTHDGLENFINSPVMKLGTKPSHAAKSEGYQ
ncbi:Nn.00g043560.m01.CDS01 [Neocucurbitaria sp. VM-36]